MSHAGRQVTPIDQLVIGFDQTLRTLFGKPQVTERKNPAAELDDVQMTESERRNIAGLIRVDHAGEVCAQALYQGQALTARSQKTKRSLERSAKEENDHLAWCESRLTELNSHTSYLNVLWYAGSLTIGALAGIAGDKYSLGFVAETERQVVKHLDKHLQRLPEKDKKSLAILQQMRKDENHHASVAIKSGAAELPQGVKSLMSMVSKCMTTVAYWV